LENKEGCCGSFFEQLHKLWHHHVKPTKIRAVS
jgi:hypothetical protein